MRMSTASASACRIWVLASRRAALTGASSGEAGPRSLGDLGLVPIESADPGKQPQPKGQLAGVALRGMALICAWRPGESLGPARRRGPPPRKLPREDVVVPHVFAKPCGLGLLDAIPAVSGRLKIVDSVDSDRRRWGTLVRSGQCGSSRADDVRWVRCPANSSKCRLAVGVCRLFASYRRRARWRRGHRDGYRLPGRLAAPDATGGRGAWRCSPALMRSHTSAQSPASRPDEDGIAWIAAAVVNAKRLFDSRAPILCNWTDQAPKLPRDGGPHLRPSESGSAGCGLWWSMEPGEDFPGAERSGAGGPGDWAQVVQVQERSSALMSDLEAGVLDLDVAVAGGPMGRILRHAISYRTESCRCRRRHLR